MRYSKNKIYLLLTSILTALMLSCGTESNSVVIADPTTGVARDTLPTTALEGSTTSLNSARVALVLRGLSQGTNTVNLYPANTSFDTSYEGNYTETIGTASQTFVGRIYNFGQYLYQKTSSNSAQITLYSSTTTTRSDGADPTNRTSYDEGVREQYLMNLVFTDAGFNGTYSLEIIHTTPSAFPNIIDTGIFTLDQTR